MVKTYKLTNQKSVPENLSAFAVYKSGSSIKTDSKADGESHHNLASTSSAPNVNIEAEYKTSIQSTSFMKQFSHRAALPFRRSCRKRKKKLKKDGDNPGTLGAREACRPSCLPEEACVQSPLVSAASDKQNVFRFAKGKLRETVQSEKRKNIPRVYQNHKAENCSFPVLDSSTMPKNSPKLLYKDEKSIELSTSQSLTGYEDDEDDHKDPLRMHQKFDENLDPNSNKVLVKQDAMEMKIEVLDESNSPHQKRAKVETEDEGHDSASSCSQLSIKTNISKHTSPVHSVNAVTGSVTNKLNNNLLKIPFPVGNSEEDGRTLFKWLIHPLTEKHFFSNIWEKKPVLVLRRTTTYANGLFSTEELNRILHECNVQYGVNLDVTSYQDDKRETHNLEGKVVPVVVWDNYKNGCSIRIKNPQAFSKPVWKLCATLQEFFKNMVGANIYLTPPGTQGFAPHYDDIEAFVLQLEGKKHWHLYSPRSPEETLPRYSSGNFSKDEIGKQIFDVVLEPGDLLYFPRGFIHQAQAVPDTHSLHITISTYQKNTWGDVMEELVPKALQRAIKENIEFRRGLPLDYLSCMGIQNKNAQQRRKEILKKISQLFNSLAEYADMNEEADERATSFLYDCLPPALTSEERSRTVLGCTVRMAKEGKPSACQCDINLDTNVRVLRKNALRLVQVENDCDDDHTTYVYHCIQNPRTYHTEEKKCFAITSSCAPLLELLIHSYPEYITVRNFPLETDEEKISVASALFEKGILLSEKPVELVEDISDS